MKKLITILALVLLFTASAQAVTVLMDENWDDHAADDHDAAHHHDTTDDGADHHPYPGPDDHRAADHGRRARTPDAGPHHHDEPGGAVRTGAHPDPGTCGTLTPTSGPPEKELGNSPIPPAGRAT